MSDENTGCAHCTVKHHAEPCPDIQGAKTSKWYCADCGAEFVSKKLCQYSKVRLRARNEVLERVSNIAVDLVWCVNHGVAHQEILDNLGEELAKLEQTNEN